LDGKEVANQKIERTHPDHASMGRTFDLGADMGTPVNDQDYQCPFKFNGTLTKANDQARSSAVSPEDLKKLHKRSGTTKRASNACFVFETRGLLPISGMRPATSPSN